MQQWREAKARDPDALLAFRVGDFFEFFFDDAKKTSRLLSLTLTARNNGAAADVPMAGFPARALSRYVGRLVRLGERVAICDQIEPAVRGQRTVVGREVVETVTPGTVLDDALLESRRNNFILSVAEHAGGFGAAALELTTGEIFGQHLTLGELESEVGRLEAAEILVSNSLAENPDWTRAVGAARERSTLRDDWFFEYEGCKEELLGAYGLHSLDGLGVQPGDEAVVAAAGALIRYVKDVKPTLGEHLRPFRLTRPGRIMHLDEMTRRNLELVAPLRPGETDATLLSVLDATVTPMGARLLRRWVLEPLVVLGPIGERHDAVAAFFEDRAGMDLLRSRLSGVTDLERLAGKLGLGRATPRDLASLRSSLGSLPDVRRALRALVSGMETSAPLLDGLRDTELLQGHGEEGGLRTDTQSGGAGTKAPALLVAGSELDSIPDALSLLESALADDPPATLAEGGIIRKGWHSELDELRESRDGARDFLSSMESREREATGIRSLKVGFNRVFGYYIEITRPNLDRVPDHYLRRQTLTAAERFIIPELKEWEAKVVDAEARMAEIEAVAFQELRERLAAFVDRLQQTAAQVAELDVLAALASVAVSRRYVRPKMHDGFELELRASRHAVVETMMPPGEFIPNDLALARDERIALVTGPNMAGKSTVLRQLGLIQLLAQIGSFVPAAKARIPIADRIFTRVGASDNLARGHSTFMVEMNETSAIVNGAGERSLILLDEIGRGTSTYDGVSIAWAVTEHIHNHIGAKTVFATHYHELTELGDRLDGVRNLKVLVREVDERIVFLRRLARGEADRSYGVQVAKLAGLPESIVERAKELLARFEGRVVDGVGAPPPEKALAGAPSQLSVFHVEYPEHPAVAALSATNPDELSPRQALDLVYELSQASRRPGSDG